MVYELSQTFFIKEVKDVKEAYTICNVILPNSDQLDREWRALYRTEVHAQNRNGASDNLVQMGTLLLLYVA